MTTFITALAILIGLLIGGAIALRAWMSAGDKARAEIDALPVLLDPRQKLAREFGVLAMPAPLLIDRNGVEVARLMGPADWASEAAKTAVTQLTAP